MNDLIVFVGVFILLQYIWYLGRQVSGLKKRVVTLESNATVTSSLVLTRLQRDHLPRYNPGNIDIHILN